MVYFISAARNASGRQAKFYKNIPKEKNYAKYANAYFFQALVITLML